MLRNRLGTAHGGPAAALGFGKRLSLLQNVIQSFRLGWIVDITSTVKSGHAFGT
jgi:hypothetical protein